LYEKFVHHEQTDLHDPQSNTRLHATLHQLFTCAVTQPFVEKLLRHVDTMKYIRIDSTAIEVIQALQSDYTLSLISNMMLPGALLLAKLRQANLGDVFHTMSISSDVGFIKPHPNMFLHTLHCDDLQPEQVVFVGDTYAQDIRGAQRVGMRTIWLNSRHESREDARDQPPDAEIHHIRELLHHPLLSAG
jgi:HAD superfamily hydrolase (TIGR01549 family)